ncbi:hypothetical protein OAU76_01680 [bacterium]|nr:hypothetical protein [Porticoccaceae bacterium]MDC3261858.1 hypothetical protein [bacterium]
MHRRYSIAQKLPAAVLSLCLLLGGISWLLLSQHSNTLYRTAVDDKSRTTLSQLDELIRTPLFTNNLISMQVALTKATQDSAIVSASLYDVDNNLITQSTQTGTLPTNLERFSRDIELQDSLIGTLVLQLDSQPIYKRHRQLVNHWVILWLIFTAISTYATFRYAEQLARRLRILNNRLPGSGEQIIDELNALEAKIQPLLSTGQHQEDNNSGYYYSLVTATIKNRQRLDNQLNRENLELLFEKIDYCTARATELYGGQRIEGANGTICFTIRSTQNSKQHLLVCLMAVYSLQQLLERLSAKLGVDLEINWSLCSGNLKTLPLFSYHEGMAALKQQSALLGEKMQEGIIGLYCTDYDIEQLSSIARFLVFDENCFILQGFPEGRQQLLEKQIVHLANVCL